MSSLTRPGPALLDVAGRRDAGPVSGWAAAVVHRPPGPDQGRHEIKSLAGRIVTACALLMLALLLLSIAIAVTVGDGGPVIAGR